MGIYDFFTDFAIMSGLLIVSQILRSKITWLQNHYIPASLIAGLLGLLLGPQVFNVVTWSSEAASYPYLLICVIFGAIFLGKPLGRKGQGNVFKKVGDTFFINTGSEILCFGFALLIGGGILLAFFPDVFPEFSLLLPSGFAGGHGYAAAIGGALNEQLGRDDAVYIGQVFATVGLLVGLLGGIVCINIAARKGYTRFVSKAVQLPKEVRVGFIPQDKRESIGSGTTHSMAMDTLAWHLCLILAAFGIGYAAKQGADMLFPDLSFPLMCLTMLAGLLIQFVLKLIKHDTYVDKKTVDRCSGFMTDFLVAFGVATIKISVFTEFMIPIIIMCVIGIAWPLFLVFFVGKKLFKNFWFERSIFIFGYLTGIVAVGMTLLRCCDPDSKSETLDDFGYAYTVQSVIEVVLVAMIPLITVKFGCIPVGIGVTLIGLALLVACWLLFGWQRTPGNALRPGEAEKMQKP